jgi:AcrR family transcriptional regulator
MSDRSLITDMEQNGKREQIIAAATNILRKENFQNMKTASIAREAGIAEGTIYRYFSSKRELFLEVLKSVSTSLGRVFLKVIDPNRGLKENLLGLAEKFYNQRDEVEVLYRILYKAFSEVEDEDIREALAKSYFDALGTIRVMLLSCLSKEEISLSETRLSTITMYVWGIGDIMWKNHVFSGSLPQNPETYKDIAESLYGMIVST